MPIESKVFMNRTACPKWEGIFKYILTQFAQLRNAEEPTRLFAKSQK